MDLPPTSDYTLKYLSQRNENLFSHRNVNANAQNSLFAIFSKLETKQCPSMGEWLNKFWYIHTMEHYSERKKKKEDYSHTNYLNEQQINYTSQKDACYLILFIK